MDENELNNGLVSLSGKFYVSVEHYERLLSASELMLNSIALTSIPVRDIPQIAVTGQILRDAVAKANLVMKTLG